MNLQYTGCIINDFKLSLLKKNILVDYRYSCLVLHISPVFPNYVNLGCLQRVYTLYIESRPGKASNFLLNKTNDATSFCRPQIN